MSGLKIVTGPASTPVSRIEFQEHLRLDEGVDITQLSSFIQAATNWAENYTNKFFINRSCQMALDSARELDVNLWEGTRTGYFNLALSDYIELSAAPVVSVQSVKYYADDDTESTWDASNYYVDTFSEPARISLRTGGTYPTDLRKSNGLEINFIAGYGENAFNVPEPIRLAILQYATYLYEHRGDNDDGIVPSSAIKSLLDPYRVLRFSSSSYGQTFKSGVI